VYLQLMPHAQASRLQSSPILPQTPVTTSLKVTHRTILAQSSLKQTKRRAFNKLIDP
jgi:hypothetical protein